MIVIHFKRYFCVYCLFPISFCLVHSKSGVQKMAFVFWKSEIPFKNTLKISKYFE